MLDRDVMLLQIAATLIDSNEFLVHILNRFNLMNWAREDYEVNYYKVVFMNLVTFYFLCLLFSQVLTSYFNCRLYFVFLIFSCEYFISIFNLLLTHVSILYPL